ncbi:hypothetical protein [Anabaena sphaerica]|uniref:hypothetical protein n=1 Tax=Anabaena sphaerica TaxID=212446 RepID=UPI001F54B731|nr:hypothetical protein [Anabaena sphaerica]
MQYLQKKGTGNREQGTDKKQKLLSLKLSQKKGTGNREQGTGNREQGTDKKQKLLSLKLSQKNSVIISISCF